MDLPLDFGPSGSHSQIGSQLYMELSGCFWMHSLCNVHMLSHRFCFLYTQRNHILGFKVFCTLLQGLTRFSATQTGCRWLISYIEQNKFLACGPEFSVEFSLPPEFYGGVTEKYLSTGWARTFVLQIRKQIFYHCATAPLCTISYDIHCVPSWDFPAVSVVTGSRIFRPYLVDTCRDFPAVSAVTGSRIFRPYQVVTCQDFPAVCAVTGSQIFRPYL